LKINVEVAFATSAEQVLIELEVDDGATVETVLLESGIYRRFPGVGFSALQAGIWGRPVERDHAVRAGDRVELYRPLVKDPRDARRERALDG
jgi:putative ubiquitin-RnfH superfamily antitoxin RatB of RatAB toxin-antitoxin module